MEKVGKDGVITIVVSAECLFWLLGYCTATYPLEIGRMEKHWTMSLKLYRE